jgi:hypothetical protein
MSIGPTPIYLLGIEATPGLSSRGIKVLCQRFMSLQDEPSNVGNHQTPPIPQFLPQCSSTPSVIETMHRHGWKAGRIHSISTSPASIHSNRSSGADKEDRHRSRCTPPFVQLYICPLYATIPLQEPRHDHTIIPIAETCTHCLQRLMVVLHLHARRVSLEHLSASQAPGVPPVIMIFRSQGMVTHCYTSPLLVLTTQ